MAACERLPCRWAREIAQVSVQHAARKLALLLAAPAGAPHPSQALITGCAGRARAPAQSAECTEERADAATSTHTLPRLAAGDSVRATRSVAQSHTLCRVAVVELCVRASSCGAAAFAHCACCAVCVAASSAHKARARLPGYAKWRAPTGRACCSSSCERCKRPMMTSSACEVRGRGW